MDGISPTFCFKPLIVFSMCAILSDSSLHHPRGGVRVMKSKKEDKLKINYNAYLHTQKNIIQLSPEGEVNSGGYIPRREASRYISTALHRP